MSEYTEERRIALWPHARSIAEEVVGPVGERVSALEDQPAPTWGNLPEKPAVVAAGATQAEARAAVGAASTQQVTDAVNALVASSPAALDTLRELAQALGDDPNFATTMSTALANRVRVDTATQGLNATQQQNARANIGAMSNLNGLERGSVPAGTNCDSLVENGTRLVVSANNVAGLNYPMTGIAGFVTTYRSMGDYMTQDFMPIQPSVIQRFWRRVKNGTSWGPWVEIAPPLSGTGSPIGVITPSRVGLLYTDVNATSGARVWISTGATNATWEVAVGDTSPVPIGPLLRNNAKQFGTASMIRRTGQMVELFIAAEAQSWNSGGTFMIIPQGFRPHNGEMMSVSYNVGKGAQWIAAVGSSELKLYAPSIGEVQRYRWSWITGEQWPTTLTFS